MKVTLNFKAGIEEDILNQDEIDKIKVLRDDENLKQVTQIQVTLLQIIPDGEVILASHTPDSVPVHDSEDDLEVIQGFENDNKKVKLVEAPTLNQNKILLEKDLYIFELKIQNRKTF